MAVKKNIFPLIGDITLRLEKRENRTACVVSLDMGREEVPVNTGVFEVSFTRAYLRVVCNGYEVVKSSRYGIPRQNQLSLVKKRTEKGTNHARGAQAALGVEVSASSSSHPAATAKANSQLSTEVTQTICTKEESETEIAYHLVKARGGDTWEIGDKALNTTLDGNFLDDDVLFEFAPARDGQGNKRSIELYLIVQQSDMELQLTASNGLQAMQNSFPHLNKSKVSKIFAGKCLAKAYSLEEPYKGKFAISYIEEDVPDEYFPE